MTCGIWKRSLLPSGFISLFQPLRLQHGSQLPVPCSGASWTSGTHRDPPWRAKGLPRVQARNPCCGPALFHTYLRSREGRYPEKMKPLARQPWLLGLEGKDRTKASVFSYKSHLEAKGRRFERRWREIRVDARRR